MSLCNVTYHSIMVTQILENPRGSTCAQVGSEGWPAPGLLGRGPPFCWLVSPCSCVALRRAATAVLLSDFGVWPGSETCDAGHHAGHSRPADVWCVGPPDSVWGLQTVCGVFRVCVGPPDNVWGLQTVCWQRSLFPVLPLATQRKGVLGLAIMQHSITVSGII